MFLWKQVPTSIANSKVNLQFFQWHKPILISSAMYPGEEGDIRVVLHTVCHYEVKEMVYFLLVKGADPNIVGQYIGSSSELLPL
jgi:hypothetical protein